MKKLKRILVSAVAVFAGMDVLACEVCEKQQPKVLRGIAHGAGPQSDWDYVVVCCAVVMVLISLFYTIKWTMYPGEKEREHIKHSIFN